MTKNDIIVKTVSFGDIPLIDISSSDFRYSAPYPTHHGIQVNENLVKKEEEIKKLCSEISDRMFELYKLVNE